jgi:starvation-inducible DNA-binding protein
MNTTGQPGKCGTAPPSAQPILNQRAKPIQPYGTTVRMPVALPQATLDANAAALNQILVDSIYLRELYKKGHFQVRGATFRQMHRLFERHFRKQNRIVDRLGDRVETLGGVSVVVPHDVAEKTKIPRAPIDREELPVQLSRLIEAHEIVLKECHEAVKLADQNGDDGTVELLSDYVILPNEKQVWRLSSHLTNTPLVCATP